MIVVKTNINKDITKVWEYWTTPEHIMNWNFASEDWHCPKSENDLRAGGDFIYQMASKDGKMAFDFKGTYDEVTLHEKIRYTIEDGRKVEILFIANEDQCEVIESFDPESTNPADLQKAGWQSILDNFKKYSESL